MASPRFWTRRDRAARPRHDRCHADQGRTGPARSESARRGLAGSTDVQPWHPEIAGAEARRRGHRAYLEEAERLREVDANIHRVVLENELKAEHQEFLQERNRDRDDSDGRPGRDSSEIQSWAREHNLPCDDQGHLQFPDVRIEYDLDGHDHTLEVEVMTPHYRGAHAAAKSGSGFTLYFSTRSGGCGRSGGRTPSIIEELLR